VLLLGVPAVAFFVLKKSPSATDQLPADAASAATPENKGILEGSDEEADIQDGEEIPGAMLPLDTFVVNLLNGNKYVRCQVQLEFTEREVPKKFYAKLVPLRDAMITMLSNRTPEELSVQKGRDQLKADLKELVNEYLKKEVVKQVYFTQFVIQ
jgi:flagellar FliL protein